MCPSRCDVRSARKAAFTFGDNWSRFVERYLDPESIEQAIHSLVGLLGTDDLSGRSLVDAGCGSGLSSLAACRLGAARIVSFDLDPDSVRCCRYLREREGSPRHWQVMEGSALDEQLLGELGAFDIVYSWGVLHHTGDMWRAMGLVARLVAANGLLAIAIYNRVETFGPHVDGRFGPSRFWVPVKRLYHGLPRWLQSPIDLVVMAAFWTQCLLRLRSPIAAMRQHRKDRGMELRTDIRDWLGGYPYEYAAPDEVRRHLEPRGFELESLIRHGGLRCNEYLFRRSQAHPRRPETRSLRQPTSDRANGAA